MRRARVEHAAAGASFTLARALVQGRSRTRAAQGPVFNEQELATIALSLDERERQVMAESGVGTDDFRRFSEEASGNVSLDGNFSIQVLDEALRVWGLACTPLASSEPCAVAARRAPLSERGFLCNLDKHWYAIRRLGREWWDFNSLLPAPSPVSATFLQELLAQLQEEGYTIFVVTGAWARCSLYGEPSSDGVWLTREQAAELRADAARAKAAGRTRTAAENALARAARGGGQLTLRGWRGAQDDGDDPELRRALEASLGEHADGWAQHSGAAPSRRDVLSGDEDEALARAIAASLDEPQAKRHAPRFDLARDGDADEDPELAAALAASVAAVPSVATPPSEAEAGHTTPPREPDASEPGATQLALRLPSGARIMRRFLATDTLVGVAAVLQHAHGVDMRAHVLTSGFPPRALAPPSATLAELGLANASSLINVQPT